MPSALTVKDIAHSRPEVSIDPDGTQCMLTLPTKPIEATVLRFLHTHHRAPTIAVGADPKTCIAKAEQF